MPANTREACFGRHHQAEVLRMDDDHETPFRVTVRRDQLLKDALDKVCGSSLVEQHELRVTFCREPGVDNGGLRRDVALQKVANNPSLMDGKESRRVLRHNTIVVRLC